MQVNNVASGNTQYAESTSLEYIRKLLINGFLREMDLQINENNHHITLPKLIYEECFKFFPRFDIAESVLNPLLNLNLYVAGCYLTDLSKINIIHECTQRIRRVLSIERNPPIDKIIECGITPRLIEFLSRDYCKFWELQFEAAWSLTNICSGTRDHVLHVINNEHNPNAIPSFMNLLSSESAPLQEQSIWALGNICGDSPQCRNIVLSNDILPILVPLIQSICNDITTEPSGFDQQKKTLLRNSAWAVSNLCRGKPSADAKYIVSLIPILNTLLAVDDTEVVRDTLWAYSYLTDGPSIIPSHHFPNKNDGNHHNNAQIGEGPPLQNVNAPQENDNRRNDGPNGEGEGNNIADEKKNEEEQRTVLDFIFLCDGVMNTIVGLLGHELSTLVHPAMRILGNICTSNDSDTQNVLECGVLDRLYTLLKTKHDTTRNAIKREALWTISNIMAGNQQQVQCVIDKHLISVINDIMIHSVYEISKEAVWCIANALSSANDRQIDHLVLNEHIVPNLCLFLEQRLNALQRKDDDDRDDEKNGDTSLKAAIHLKSLTALKVALEGIEKILTVENGKYALYTEQHGLLKQLEALVTMFNDGILENEVVLARCNDMINTYFKEAPSQMMHLLSSSSHEDRKHCCLILRNQLKKGSIYHCTRIIDCDDMIKHLLMNLQNWDNDVFVRNDIAFIISDLFVKLNASLKHLNQKEDVVNTKRIVLYLIDESVILPFVDFLLYIMRNKDEINVGTTILMIMEILEMVLRFKNGNDDKEIELIKFYMIKYDAVYAMKQIINDKEMLHSIQNYQNILNISSRIMKEYFKSNKYPNYEETLVHGYFREMNMNVPIHIMETCCYYGYDYNFEQNKRRSSQSILQTSVSDLVQFDFDDDDVLLDLDFGF